jgi:hypothetical protein
VATVLLLIGVASAIRGETERCIGESGLGILGIFDIQDRLCAGDGRNEMQKVVKGKRGDVAAAAGRGGSPLSIQGKVRLTAHLQMPDCALLALRKFLRATSTSTNIWGRGSEPTQWVSPGPLLRPASQDRSQRSRAVERGRHCTRLGKLSVAAVPGT